MKLYLYGHGSELTQQLADSLPKTRQRRKEKKKEMENQKPVDFGKRKTERGRKITQLT